MPNCRAHRVEYTDDASRLAGPAARLSPPAATRTQTLQHARTLFFHAAHRLALLLALALLTRSAVAVPPNKVLFDATKAQMAANADWVVDADTRNIGTSSTTHLMVAGAGSDSNPQRYPTPAPGITASTPETYWSGALSAWGIELVKRGFQVETLPFNGVISYGNASNPQDLSNYGIYIIDEPNIAFTATEKTAIINFVAAGGGLFIISDHNISDRNNDGIDSVGVLNGLVTSNGISNNVFGITYNVADVSPTSTFVASSGTDPLIHGAAGAVTQMNYHNGTTLTITGANTHGAIWQTSARSSSSVMVAYATYGLGKVVACGDSSPFDDGTGDPNDTLYNGWSGEANGDHGKLAINACLWLNPTASCTAASVQPLQSTAASCGQPISLTATASGTGTITYQWRKATVPLSNGGDFSGVNTPTLTISPFATGDAAAYDVVVTNGCGNATSNSVAVTKYTGPSIATNPVNASRCTGAAAVFTVTAAGTPAPTYQWRKGGVPLSNGGVFSGVNTPSLTISTVSPALAANYDVIVTNTCDSVASAPAQLLVDPADLGQQGGLAGRDGVHDNNDFVVFIDSFFNQQPGADLGSQGGILGSDGEFDNNDFVVFIDEFFAAC